MQEIKSKKQSAIHLAITGGIASGKSYVGEILKSKNIPVIDADEVVHQLLASDPDIMTLIRNHFGMAVFTPTGTIDRKKLGSIIFDNVQEKKRLESWLHPKVRLLINDFLESQGSSHPLVVAIIPLLFESNLEKLYNCVWLIDTPVKQQVKRLVESRGLSEIEALSRINNQMSRKDRLLRLNQCNHSEIIENSSSLDTLTQKVESALLVLDQFLN